MKTWEPDEAREAARQLFGTLLGIPCPDHLLNQVHLVCEYCWTGQPVTVAMIERARARARIYLLQSIAEVMQA